MWWAPYIDDLDDVMAYTGYAILLFLFLLSAYFRLGSELEKAKGLRPGDQTEIWGLQEMGLICGLLIVSMVLVGLFTGIYEYKYADESEDPCIGDIIVVKNLVNAPQFNGLEGQITGENPTKETKDKDGNVEYGEYWILLDNGKRLALPTSRIDVIESWDNQLGNDAGTQQFGDDDEPDIPDDDEGGAARPQVFGHVGVAETAWENNRQTYDVEMQETSGRKKARPGIL